MRYAFGFALCLLVVATMLRAADDDFAEYQGWMKSNAATVADLNQSLDSKNGPMAHTDIRKLQENLAMVMAYWQSREINDGVRYALDGTYGLAQVDLLAGQGKFEEAADALKTAQTACAGCHLTHRDKAADGSFQIKMK